jgi:hypothetical protein
VAALSLDHRRFPARHLPRHSGHPVARRPVVRHSVVPRASWLSAPGRRLSRTSQRFRFPPASTRWRRDLPGPLAARVERRYQPERPDLHGPMEASLHLHRLHGHGSARLGVERVVEAPVAGRNRVLPYRPRRRGLDPRGVDRAGSLVADGTARQHPYRSPLPGLGDLEAKPARPVETRTQPHVRQPGWIHLHQTGVGSAAGFPGQGARRRILPWGRTARAEPPGPRGKGAAPWHGRATAPLGTQLPESLDRWWSCPCATGRRLVGRTPRWGRVEIRLGPAWVRYRGTATPETDPPSTFHRPVVPGRHRARSSRLRVTLPRCRPSPW